MHPARPVARPHRDREDWKNLRGVLPYFWEYQGRVLLALASLILAKLANVGVPLLLKDIVDALDRSKHHTVALPIALLASYGVLRMASTLFNELRDAVFARVRYRAMRRLSITVLQHLHALTLRFHLERRTGAISRDLERGARSVSSILNYLVFNILPTLAELGMVAAILIARYELRFALVTFLTVAVYVAFTLAVTEWRMEYRYTMNAMDSKANNQAIDSLINYETVKSFGNEAFEARRYDETLKAWEDAAVKTQTSMSALNFGQGAIIALGATLIMIFAAEGVLNGHMTLGDLVLVNALLLQLFLPLNFLGIVYRQIKYALADMDLTFKLLAQSPEIRDRPGAAALRITHGAIRFEHVDFHYRPDRQILFDVDFEVRPGQRVAVVGASGAGKSTLVRLLFRNYDVVRGSILIDGQDLRAVTQQSLRNAIGLVPQDTVLFNESIFYNIAYARPGVAPEEVHRAARLAHIHDFIERLPHGYDTLVGERGLKLSGGEKQRIAIARAILKGPHILVFDEATSALDSESEKLIQEALAEVSAERTTLVIAHRLSTVVDADQILVMEGGRIIERGTHRELLAHGGPYAYLWALQQEERRREERAA